MEALAIEKDLAARAAVRRVRPGQRIALGTGSTAAYAIRALAENDEFDLMIDGADEVTPQLALTKGGGGALFREKFLARLSKELLIIVDHTKLVDRLGTRAAIPLEVVPFARPVVARRLTARRFGVRVRAGPNGGAYRTENGNEVLDLRPPAPVDDPRGLEEELKAEPGVVDTGLFVGLASRVYVGLPGDTVDEITAPAPAKR